MRTPPGPAPRLLVVDDEEDVREMLAALLREEGYDVFTVSDAEAAVRAVHSTRFDVATMDLRMPGMSGREAVERLREIDPHLAVIVVSGYVTPDERRACTALGVSAILSKPFDLDDFLEVVRIAIAQRARDQGPSATLEPGDSP